MGTSNYKVTEVPNGYEDPTLNGDLHAGSHGVRVAVRTDLAVAPRVLTMGHEWPPIPSFNMLDCVTYTRVGVNSGLDAYNMFVADNPSRSYPGWFLVHRQGTEWWNPYCRVESPMPPPSPPHAYNQILSHDILAGSSYTYAEGTVWGHVDGTDHGNIGTTIPVTDVLIFRHKSDDAEINRHYQLLLASHKIGTYIPQYESSGRRRAERIAVPDAETDGVSGMVAPVPQPTDDDSDPTSRRLSEPEESPSPSPGDEPVWGPAFMPDGTMIGNIFFYASPPQQSLSSSMVLDETIETFLVEPFTLTLANELNVNASDVTVTAQGGSVNLQIDVVVPKRRGLALLDQMTTLVQDTSHMNALFNTTVLSAGPVSLVDFSPPPSPPPYPPSKAPTPPPPSPPPGADVCAKGALDNACSPFAGADWSSAMSSYHFYLYDETPDGIDLRLWEWPRVTPRDNMLARNGVCEDGLPSRNASIPEGNYYVAFGGPDCATHHVNLSTGLIAGCGRVDLVPCTWGTDCFDCGRSATMKDIMDEYNRRPKYEPYPRRTANARRRLEEAEELQALNARRGVQAQSLPALHEKHEMRGLARALKTATSYHLPKPWLDALQIKDHVDW